MGKPHKWAEVIHAIADGRMVQFYDGGEWIDFDDTYYSPIDSPEHKWRIKSEVKPDVVYYGYVESNMDLYCAHVLTTKQNAMDNFKLTFDGETGKLKSVEVING